jgi:hypothetical protein
MILLTRPIEEIQRLKTDSHRLPTDVFQDHQVQIEVSK